MAAAGGAVSSQGAVVSFDECYFVSDSTHVGASQEHGGGIAASGSGHTDVRGCLFVGGYSVSGSAIWAEAPHIVRIERTIFTGLTGHVLAGPAGSYSASCSDFHGNDDPLDPQGLGAWLPGVGNFVADPLFCDAPSGDWSLRANSMCAAVRTPCGQRVGPLDPACDARGIYVGTRPSGLAVLGDGVPATSYAWFDWAPGTTHEVSVPESQERNGVLYRFQDWSDGGARTHLITTDPFVEPIIARHDSLYRLDTAAVGRGTVTPAAGYLPPMSSFTLEAVPDSGWAFLGWAGTGRGSYTGQANPVPIILEGPITEVATFREGHPLTVTTTPPGLPVRIDGNAYVTPVSVSLPEFTSSHVVEVDSLVGTAPGLRQRFVSWDVGGGPAIFVEMANTPLTVHAEFTPQCELTFTGADHAHVTPGSGWHDAGATVQIRAVPDYGWTFVRWVGTGSGSYTGPANPAFVTLSDPVHEQPVLVPAFAGHGLEMTISGSDSDPWAVASPATGAPRPLYLWLTCSEIGLSALQMGTTGTLSVLGFEPGPLVLNAGTPTALLLAVGGCPVGNPAYRLLGHWNVFDTGGTLCVGRSGADSVFATVDCAPVVPSLWPGPRVTGFASDGSTPCVVGTNVCEGPTALALSGLTAIPGDRSVIVSWQTSDASGGERFRLFRTETGAAAPLEVGRDPVCSGGGCSVTDDAVLGDHTYEYEVTASDDAGLVLHLGSVRITTPRWEPRITRIEGVAPNPSSGRVDVRFSLAERGPVRLAIYDVAGRRVSLLADGWLEAGTHDVSWDGRGSSGRASPGVYFVRFEGGGHRAARKLTLMAP